jgi:HEAT repeat protein
LYDQAAVPVLLELFESPNAVHVCAYLVQNDLELGKDARRIASVNLFKNGNKDWRLYAVGGLRWLYQGETAIAELLREAALFDPDAEVRYWAIDGLARTIGAGAREPLLGALKDANLSVRARAATELAGMRLEVELALPVLLEALQDEHYRDRWFVAESLGRLGSRAKAAVPALRQALRDQEDLLRNAAALALNEIDQASAEDAASK